MKPIMAGISLTPDLRCVIIIGRSVAMNFHELQIWLKIAINLQSLNFLSHYSPSLCSTEYHGVCVKGSPFLHSPALYSISVKGSSFLHSLLFIQSFLQKILVFPNNMEFVTFGILSQNFMHTQLCLPIYSDGQITYIFYVPISACLLKCWISVVQK